MERGGGCSSHNKQTHLQDVQGKWQVDTWKLRYRVTVGTLTN